MFSSYIILCAFALPSIEAMSLITTSRGTTLDCYELPPGSHSVTSTTTSDGKASYQVVTRTPSGQTIVKNYPVDPNCVPPKVKLPNTWPFNGSSMPGLKMPNTWPFNGSAMPGMDAWPFKG